MGEQTPVRIRRAPVPVEGVALEEIRCLHHALRKCAEACGAADAVVALDTGIDAPTWARIKHGKAGVKGDFLLRLMDACGNELPLLWLLHTRGYDVSALRKRESELERELREERELRGQVEQELETIKRFMRDTRAE